MFVHGIWSRSHQGFREDLGFQQADWCGLSQVTLVSHSYLVTLVSHSQPLWRGVTQGGVAPVFPFRENPYLC